MTALLLAMALVPSSYAELPLPSYKEELARAEWHRVNEALESACAYEQLTATFSCTEDVHAVIERIDRFQDQVFPDSGLEYLAGLALKYQGKNAKADRRYRTALELDPTHDAAWYDLGEIMLMNGDLGGAMEAFTKVAEMRATGPRSWVGPWRQAEVAAHQQSPEAFELHMREALRRGFSFRQIEGLPNWQAFYADPVMRDSIEKLVTVYGDRKTLETLRR